MSIDEAGDKSLESMTYNSMVQMNHAFEEDYVVTAFKLLETCWFLMRAKVLRSKDRKVIDELLINLRVRIEKMKIIGNKVALQDMKIKTRLPLIRLRMLVMGMYSSLYGEIRYTHDPEKVTEVSGWIKEVL